MPKTKRKAKTFPFDEMRRLLRGIGYKEKITENAHVFHRAKKDLVIFRRYDGNESVDWGDVVSTRKFLDMRGILEASEFDAFLDPQAKPA
jgi:hypothetical protein